MDSIAVRSSEAQEFLEGAYRPLLVPLRRVTPADLVEVAEGCFVLWLPERGVTLSWRGRPLPDSPSTVDEWLVQSAAGESLVEQRRLPVLLAAALLTAADQARA